MKEEKQGSYAQDKIDQLQAGLMDLYARLRGNNTVAEETALRAKIFDQQQNIKKLQQELKSN